jgi:hypothetical protein
MLLYQDYNPLSKINLVGKNIYLYLWGGFRGGPVNTSPQTKLRHMIVFNVLLTIVAVLMIAVVIWGFANFEEYEIGIEFLPKDYNSFELGVSNRNYVTDDDGLEQELRIGLLIFSVIFLFRRFGA